MGKGIREQRGGSIGPTRLLGGLDGCYVKAPLLLTMADGDGELLTLDEPIETVGEPWGREYYSVILVKDEVCPLSAGIILISSHEVHGTSFLLVWLVPRTLEGVQAAPTVT